MTDKEWQTCDDPDALLACLGARPSARQLRLFGTACCRRLVSLLSERGIAEEALVFSERLADGTAEPVGLFGVLARLQRAAWSMPNEGAEFHIWRGTELIMKGARREVGEGLRKLAAAPAWRCAPDAALSWDPNVSAFPDDPSWRTAWRRERRAQADLVREVFGALLRPSNFELWRTQNVMDLARTIYDEAAFDRMPILADALMDAGCDGEVVLAHCRGGTAHVRGCWVVDRILDKG